MAVFGSIIKGMISLRDKWVDEPNPVLSQQKELIKLLDKAKNTDFGKAYNFEEILNSPNPQAAFKDEVPYFDYNQMHEQWWSKLDEGASDVSWPGHPHYFALSSGTTGDGEKRIPVTQDMLESIRQTGIKQVAALSNFDLSSDFYEKEILMLGSSTDLKKRNGHKEGEISGISASNIPFWFSGYYKPGFEIARIDDWDERVQRIAEEAENWDVGALSGIPSWIELMLKRIIEYYDLNHIHELWPNLEVFASGGVAFEAYEKSFNKLLGHPILIIDTYLASEGFLAYQCRPQTDAMKLVTDNGIYFEFIPHQAEYTDESGKVKPSAPSLTLDEVEEGVEYILVISTVAGAWRYMIGDTIRFTDIERAEIKITGRTKFFLNVVGSQLSVNKMNDAMLYLEDKYDLRIPEFTVSAVRTDGDFYHKWYLGIEGEYDEAEITESLDKFLREVNKNYNVARTKALKGVKVVGIHPDIFNEWNAKRKKKGGQVKMEKVMTEDTFKEWESFVQEYSDQLCSSNSSTNTIISSGDK